MDQIHYANSIGLKHITTFEINSKCNYSQCPSDKIVYVLHRCGEPLKVGQSTNWINRFKHYIRTRKKEILHADMFEAKTMYLLDELEKRLRSLLVKEGYTLPLDNTSCRLVKLGLIDNDNVIWDALRSRPIFITPDIEREIIQNKLVYKRRTPLGGTMTPFALRCYHA
jgi:hypothetical protein